MCEGRCSFLTLRGQVSSCQRLPKAPQFRQKASCWGADEIMAEARDVSDHVSEPNFSFLHLPRCNSTTLLHLSRYLIS